jgi:hypothetical protein
MTRWRGDSNEWSGAFTCRESAEAGTLGAAPWGNRAHFLVAFGRFAAVPAVIAGPADLGRSAARAERPGGYVAQATFLAWAADLIPDARGRAVRPFAAAQAYLVAGTVSWPRP